MLFMKTLVFKSTLAALLIGSGTLFAQTNGSWNDGAANDNWLDGANWTTDPSIPQAAGDAATFGTDGTGGVINLGGNISLDALNFDGANAYTISPLAAETITMTGASNINVQGTATHVIQTVIAGTNVLIDGGGTLTLDANNTFDGVTIDGTAVNIGAAGNLGVGSVSLDGATLNSNASFTIGQNLILINSGSTFDTAGGDLTIGGTLSGSQSLIKSGVGKLTLTQDSSASYTSNNVQINQGTLSVSNGNQIGGIANVDAINFNNLATLEVTSSTTINRNLIVNSGGGGTINVTSGEVTLDGRLSASTGSQHVKEGSGKLILTRDSSSDTDVSIVINEGVISISDGNQLGGGDALTFNGGTLENTATTSVGQELAMGTGGGTINTNGGDLTANGAVSGSTTLTKTGADKLTLTQDSSGSFTGDIDVQQGTLSVSNGNQLGSGSNISLDGSTLESTASTAVAQDLNLGAGGGTVNAVGSGNMTLNGTLNGSTDLTKIGNRKVILTQDSSGSFSGEVNVNQGTLSISDGNQLGTGTNINLDSGTLEGTASTTVNQAVQLGASGGTLSATNTGEVTMGSTLNGTSGLNINGDGTGKVILTQDSSSTYSGEVTLNNGGTVSITDENQLGSASKVNFNRGTLENTGSLTVTKELALGANRGTVRTNGGDMTLNGQISGSGDFFKSGADQLNLAADNSGFTGKISINDGTLAVQNANALGDTGGTTQINKGTLLLDTVSVSGENLIMNGRESGDEATLAANGNHTWDTNISGQNASTNRIISNSGTFTVSGNYNAEDRAKELVLGGAGTVDVDGDIDMDTSTQTLRKTGAGTVNLNSATNNFGAVQSQVIVEGGTLNVVGSSFNDGTELQINGGTLDLNGNTHEVGQLSGTGGTLDIGVGSTLTINSKSDATMAADIISGGLIKNGAGTLTLSGNNIYAGNTVLNGGQITAASNSALGASGNSLTMSDKTSLNLQGDITITGVSLAGVQGTGAIGGGAIRNISGDNTWDGSATLAGNTTVNVATGSSLTFDDGISGGAHNLSVIGGGTLQSNAAAGYSGNTNVTGSTIKLGANNAFAQTTLNLSSGATLDLNGFDQTFADINSSSTSNTIALNSKLTLDDGGVNQSLTVTLTGAGDFEKAGNGTLTFSGNSSGFTGDLTHSAGVLKISSSHFENTNSFVANSILTLSASSSTTFNGNEITLSGGGSGIIVEDVNDVFTNVSLNRDVTLATDSFIYSNLDGTDTFTLAGTTSLGSNVLYFDGSGEDEVIINDLVGAAGSVLIASRDGSVGEVTLSNANTNFFGGATIQTGTLTVKNNDALVNSAAISVESTGTLNVETASMNGGTVLLRGKVSSNVSGGMNNNIELNGNGSVGGTGTLTINGNITETGGARTLTKEDSGHVIVAGTPSYTGSTVITGGTLSGNIPTSNLNLNGGAYGSSGTFTRAIGTGSNQVQFGSTGGFSAVGGALDVNLGGAAGTLNFGSDIGTTLILNSIHATNDITLTNPLGLNGQNAVIQTSSQTAHIDGGISGNGTFTKNGSGTLSFDSANTYTGTTTVNSGTLIANNANNTAFDDSSALEINSGGEVVLNFDETVSQLDIDGSGDISGSGTLTVASQVNSSGSNFTTRTATVASGLNFTNTTGNFDVAGTKQTLSVDGIVSGPTNGIVKTGTGILELNNLSNSYDGTTTVNGGGIQIAGVGALGQNPDVQIGSSGYIGTEDNSAGGPQALVDIVSATSTGTVGLDGGNTFTGDIDLTGKDSSLRIGSSSSATLTGSITPQGSTYRLGGGGGNLRVSSVLEDDGGARNVNIGANGSLEAGTVTLDGNNTYTGTTTVEEGTLVVDSANALGAGSSSIQLGVSSGPSATLIAGSGAGTVSRNINVVNSSGTATISGSAGGNFSGDISLNQGVTLASSTFSGEVTGNGDVRVLSSTINGTINTSSGDFIIDGEGGTTTLNTALSHNGSTIIEDDPFFTSDPRLEVTGDNYLLSSSPLIVDGDLDINNTTQSVAQLSGGSSGDIIAGSSGSLSFGSNNATTSYSGDFNGGNYDKQGSGTFNTGAINSDSFTVTQGTVNASSVSGDLTVNSGATMDTNSGSIDTLSGGGDLVINSGLNVKDGTFSGDITGSGSLSKTSSGILTLQGMTTVGALQVMEGTLANSSGQTITADVEVESGGTLNNNGIVDGLVNIQEGALLTGSGQFMDAVTVSGGLGPGNSPGTMVFDSDLTLENTSVTTIELVSTSSYDILQVAGNLTLAGTLVLDSQFAPNATGIVLTVFDVTGSISGNFADIQDTNNYWDTSQLSTNGTITSILAVVPEPSSSLLFLFGGAVLAIFRRRK
jgi:fibronectin-binding autotransporter adhesin